MQDKLNDGGTKLRLRLAAVAGIVASGLLLFSFAVTSDTSEDGWSYTLFLIILLSTATIFYLFLGAFAEKVSESHSRRKLFIYFVAFSLVLVTLSGGPGGLVFFGLPTAILLWLAIKG